MAWSCPRCGALNFSEGPCECCAYGKAIYVFGVGSTSPEPEVKWYY